MCRYGLTNYKPHYACFPCRKAFKRRLKRDVQDAGPDRAPRCPTCRGPVADMGLDWAAPKQRDAKAWRLLSELFEVGITFHSCGCGGPGYRPRRARELRAFLVRTRAEYMRTLHYWQRDAPRSLKADARRNDAIRHWRARIAALDRALAE